MGGTTAALISADPYNKATNGKIVKGNGCDQVVMYSATWCGACRKKKQAFAKANIKVIEHFVDKNPAMNQIFRQKAKAAKHRVAYPTIEINGKLHANYSADYFSREYNLCKVYG